MKTLLYLLALLGCCTAVAQTNVSGLIAANTTWTANASPYIVTGNILVAQGYTLTIEPGTVVKFNTDKALQIDGELIAIGTPYNKIVFTSNQVTPAPGDWAKINFSDLCTDAQLDSNGNYLSGTIMKYCDILYAGGIGAGAFDISQSSPYFNHCNISYSSSSGILANLSSFRLDSSTISFCLKEGLKLANYDLTNNDIEINNDTITNNSLSAIYLGSGNAPVPTNYLKIEQCYIAYNKGAIQGAFTGHSNLKIEENYFAFNNDVISMTGFGNTLISCNTFTGNTGKILSLTNSSIALSSNLFIYNNSGNNAVISLENYSAGGPVEINNNLLLNNTSSYSCFKINPTINNSQLTHVAYNKFADNNTPKTVLLSVASGNGNSNFLYFKYNTFSDALAQYELYNDISYGLTTVYVDSNYWGGNNLQHIDSVIYDYFDDANKSVVYYSPILSSAITVDTSCIFPIATLPLAVNAITTNINCYGQCNGSINLNVNGGMPPYTYTWSNALPDSANQSNLCAANYQVTITDGSSQSVSGSFIINEPGLLTLSVQKTDVLCHGDSSGCVNAFVNGGVAPYTYTWSFASPDTSSVCGISAGPYFLEVTDQNQCSVSSSFVVSEPSALNYNYQQNQPTTLVSNDGSVLFDISGGSAPYGTSIDGSAFSGNTTYTNLAIGCYTFVISDALGCSTAPNTICLTGPNAIQPIDEELLSVFPNPADGIATISCPLSDKYELQLLNSNGQLILTEPLSTNLYQLNTEDFAEGVYQLSIKTETAVFKRPLIIAR